ncbi:MAG: hypothetical protein HUJ60_00855, partial [Bacilli bacterium]|nr:hypothetical protein [Bacilli bacterium]
KNGALNFARFLLENLKEGGKTQDERMGELSWYVFENTALGASGKSLDRDFSFGFMTTSYYVPKPAFAPSTPLSLKKRLSEAKEARKGYEQFYESKLAALKKRYPDEKINQRVLADRVNFNKPFFSKNHGKARDGVEKPAKRFLLGLSIALELTVEEAEELLVICGHGLDINDYTDLTVFHFLEQGYYYGVIDDIDAILVSLKEARLGAEDRE